MNFKMLIIVGGLAVAGGSVHAAPPEVEAEIDRQLGILDREWVVAPVRILGRRALRMEAGSRAGSAGAAVAGRCARGASRRAIPTAGRRQETGTRAAAAGGDHHQESSPARFVKR